MAVTKQKSRSAILFAVLMLTIVGWQLHQSMLWAGPVMSAGISDSGDYVVTTHLDNSLILWNIKDEKWRALATNANIYSAGFVPGRDAFLWQGLDDRVTVQTIEGKTLLEFEHFPTYGHVISGDLTTYLSADDNWNVFTGYGSDMKPILSDGISPSFQGSGKLLNISLARDKPLFITAGFGSNKTPIEDFDPVDPQRRFSRYSGVTLWSAHTGEPVHKFRGNSSKTHAAISPDGQWVVSGDENGISLEWNTSNPDKVSHTASYTSGVYSPGSPDDPDDYGSFDDSQLIEGPPGLNNSTIAVAFIHNSEYYLRFGNNSHYAALFRTGSPWPVKYFDLGESPQLVTFGSQYSRNTAIATAPEAGVLVMGHRSGGGISVYRFDAEALTLERVWVVE